MTYLTKDFDADKALIGLRVFCEDVKLLSQLITLSIILLGFTSDTYYEVGGYCRDSYRCKDTAEWRDELASIISLAMLSIKRFKAIYSYIMSLVKEVIKVGVG